MRRYTVDVLYDVSYAASVAVEAANPEEACRRAIDKADDMEAWKSTDHASDPYILDIREQGGTDPANAPTRPVAIPETYTRDGPPPIVTVDLTRPQGTMEVAGGTFRMRFLHPGFAVATEISDPPPPPGNKPLVTVVRRPDGTPEISVTGGTAHVRVTGWDSFDPPLPIDAARADKS